MDPPKPSTPKNNQHKQDQPPASASAPSPPPPAPAPKSPKPNFGHALPELNGSRDGTYLSQFYNQPLMTTLTSFSHVANLVRNPYELINNVDEFVRQASGNRRKCQRVSESSDARSPSIAETRGDSSLVPESPPSHELDTFAASSSSGHNISSDSSETVHVQKPDAEDTKDKVANRLPIPALPPIGCSKKRGRLEPLTVEEYENNYRLKATDLELIERVFYGGMSCNQLRAALWPYLFGLIIHRGQFDKISSASGETVYVFVEHQANVGRWLELRKLYNHYKSQWQTILPDQELRFSTFRERKSLIERDVIRCDRLHPFYAEQPQNLSSLTTLLMTYMMYDFDIGYVQGMSDLAGPILYMYNGDVTKAFWVFVEVMKLFRRNFELTQKTIHFQLACLYKLIKVTDPIFAEYLEENETSNCFFVFRAIVCQFKRELMKKEEDDYTNVLFLWDTIWSVKRRCELSQELEALKADIEDVEMDTSGEKTDHAIVNQPASSSKLQKEADGGGGLLYPMNSNQADFPRHALSETEIFVLSLCLSMIRRERDLVLANSYDGTEIHLHFIDPNLTSDLNGFIEHATNIYSYLKNDFDLSQLFAPLVEQQAGCGPLAASSPSKRNTESPMGSAEGYDLLSDFLIINGASGS